MDLTFLIPTRIETEDRLRNIISSVSYLLKHTDAKVIVKEVAPHNNFLFRALPIIKKYVDVSNLSYLYDKSEEPLFCKSKVLNDLIVASETEATLTPASLPPPPPDIAMSSPVTPNIYPL